MYAGIDNMNLKVSEVGLRAAVGLRWSVNRCGGGLPMVFLQRQRAPDRLEHLGTVPFGEFTQNLFQTRDQIAVMQQTLHCRRPYDYRRPRHGQFGRPQTSPTQTLTDFGSSEHCEHTFNL